MNILSFNSIFNSREEHGRFVQDRVINVEKYCGDLCQSLGAYTKQSARLRDKTDSLVKVIYDYAANETINQSLKTGLENIGQCLSAVGDNRDAQVTRLEQNVVGIFQPIGVKCKDLREEIKMNYNASEREHSRKKQLNKLKDKTPKNRQKILLAEADLARASAEVSRSVRTLEENIDTFESEKLSITKKALYNFIKAEMSLHSKELELLTKAFIAVSQIDEEQDLQAFREALKSPPKKTVMKNSASFKDSLLNLFIPNSSSTNTLASTSSSGGDKINSNATTPLSPTSKIISLHSETSSSEEETEEEDEDTSELTIKLQK